MPRLPWLLGPYWPMIGIRTPVSYATVVGVASARVFVMSSSLPAVLLIDSVIARAVARFERQFAVGGATNPCMRKHSDLLAIAGARRSSGLFECTPGCIARGDQGRHTACTNLVYRQRL